MLMTILFLEFFMLYQLHILGGQQHLSIGLYPSAVRRLTSLSAAWAKVTLKCARRLSSGARLPEI